MRPWIVIAMFVVLLIVPHGAVTFGGVPMGPPMATLEEGQWAFGAEYGYSKADLEAYGDRVWMPGGADPIYALERMDIDGLVSHMVFGGLAYGVSDNWDLFLRLGLADARDDMTVRTTSGGGGLERLAYHGGHGFAYGIGTRATVARWGPWTFGGLAQVTWLNPDADDFMARDLEAANAVSTGRLSMDAWHTQVALAAVYQIDTFHFWTGPFLQFTEGGYERDGRTYVDGVQTGTFRSSGDIEEASRLGIHCGATWEASPQFHCQMEGQFTADSWLLGLGLIITPEQLTAGL